MNLHNYDIVIINSSGGKDSLASIWQICQLADEQGYDRRKIVISHQDLGRSEWAGTKELVFRQAEHFDLSVEVTKRRNKDGYEETLLEYVKRRGKWPSNTMRYCTSDFKRGPGSRVVTKLTKGLGKCQVLYVFGFRAQESPFRSKKVKLSVNKRLTTKTRTVHEYLPIHDWTTKQVWDVIKENDLPYHNAYQIGMPRLSCVFCIFSPFDALVIAGKANPELLEEYVKVEEEIGHTFKNGESLKEVKEAIEKGYEPVKVEDWIM